MGFYVRLFVGLVTMQADLVHWHQPGLNRTNFFGIIKAESLSYKERMAGLANAGDFHNNTAVQLMGDEDPKEIGPGSIQSIYKILLKEAFGSIRDYFVYFHKIFFEPDKTAQEIAQNKVDEKLLVRALVGGSIIAAVIDQFVGSTEDAVPDFIMIPLLMVLLFIVAAIIHLPLKLLGGKASFQQTFLANIMTTVVSPPVISIAFALNAGGDPSRFGAYFVGAFFVRILSSVHKISVWKATLAAYGITSIVVVLWFLYALE